MNKEYSILIDTNLSSIDESHGKAIVDAFNANQELVDFFKDKFATRVVANVSIQRRVVNNFLNQNFKSLEAFLTEAPPLHILEKLKSSFSKISHIIGLRLVTLSYKTKIEIESI